jgi:hypothetical protein
MNLEEIKKELEVLPNKIRVSALLVLEEQKKLDDKKLAFDVAYGLNLINSNKKNATEKKAEAVINSKTEATLLIEQRYIHKKKELSLSYNQDQFTALRKIANIELEQIKANLTGN